ncbi:NAD-dependent glutamate dehydrogenase [Maudiozyma exigua]|uniref:NAD-specific glutamate dehydrogenase n=1 Tax=Maudiozyma exigua TaxID=34358 RepID=A0A9P6W854_MAUEX|nr:NAD-dependent glutamate dehydrogenase [Kazachstania exigua]
MANSVKALQVPDIASLSISSMSDYHASAFPGKDAQREQVVDLLDQQGFIPDDLIEQEVEWFYNSLGIDDLFFSKEQPALLADIIHSLYASKLDSFAKNGLKKDDSTKKALNIKNKIITSDNHAIFMESTGTTFSSLIETAGKNTTGQADFDDSYEPYQLDADVDDLFLDAKDKKTMRVVSYWTPESDVKITFAYENTFPAVSGKKITQEQLISGDIDSISDESMVAMTSVENKKLYGTLIKLSQEREGPVIKITNSKENKDEVRFLVAYKRGTTKHYYSELNSLFHYYKLRINKFFVENFKLFPQGTDNDDVVIFSIYLNKTQQSTDLQPQDLDLSIQQIEREASLLYTIPNNSFVKLYEQRQFSPQEAIYAHVSAIFIVHFINRLGDDYKNLLTQIAPKENDVVMWEIIGNLKKKLRNETFTQQMIIDVLQRHHNIVSKLYKNFSEVHYVRDDKLEKTLSYKRLSKLEPFKNDQEFDAYLNKFIPNDSPDLLILKTLNLFNKSILKTNFFITRKVAISFRLNPGLIIPKVEYPDTPYGIFFVVGNTFKAFHIRFRDIARGGIRIVCSKTQDIYDKNTRTVIDENYQLASTQQRKNKDIPEGGSKGVILLNPALTTEKDTFIAFTQYVDSIIDILIRDPLKETYVDLLGKEEILFFGPDEGTAGFVNWATLHARSRGCPWWKSFLTGKSQSLGGIPHDEYGMTSLGVRAYVNKIYETLNLNDAKIAKFQTGGPDGDLGSNEIELSTPNETYVGLLDGSGVLCDPKGLDKNELIRLAKSRSTISSYDTSKLSKEGFFVSVDDSDVMLPNGAIVANGTSFRNTFHVEVFKFVDHIDLFVPCGGRPNSITLNNVGEFIDPKTNKSRIPYIVEGANLFIAQPAKIELENHGCIFFKDASANKGGVTSSSFEVLASLALNDNDFVHKFVGLEGQDLDSGKVAELTKTSPLYDAYVEQVQKRIVYNAEQEFAQLWAINQKTGTPISELSDKLSVTINKLNDDLVDSEELWLNDTKLRDYLLLEKIIPKLLTDVATPVKILENIPDSYLKVLISSYLASSFVYQNGIDVDIGKFLAFIGELRREAYKN